jgi:hypothetical protein
MQTTKRSNCKLKFNSKYQQSLENGDQVCKKLQYKGEENIRLPSGL